MPMQVGKINLRTLRRACDLAICELHRRLVETGDPVVRDGLEDEIMRVAKLQHNAQCAIREEERQMTERLRRFYKRDPTPEEFRLHMAKGLGGG